LEDIIVGIVGKTREKVKSQKGKGKKEFLILCSKSME